MSVLHGPARALRCARELDPVWALNLVVVALAAALYAGLVRAVPALAQPHLPWWLIALAFAGAERCVVHLHFRRGAHSFSLGDIPLVFGLVFCSAQGVVIGCVVGSALVLLLDRRLPLIKLVFNLAQFGLTTCIAVLVVHALAPVAGHVVPQTWIAALLATQAAGLVTVLLITCAISLSEGLVRLRTAAHMFAMDAVVTMSNSSLGLCGVVITATDPRALPLLVVPFATLFAAYRAYLSERERHSQLDFVHEANRTLARSSEIAQALESLLAGSLAAFRAESAEVVLFGLDGEPTLHTLLGPGQHRELMQPLDSEVAAAMRVLTGDGSGGARTLESPFGEPALEHYLKARGVRHAIAAPLQADPQVIGMILLADRSGVVSAFNNGDLTLLETLASNASVALQHDRLEQALDQLGVAQQQLHHEAYHDALTQLANRALFGQTVKRALADYPDKVAVLFIDLDNFKTVNDTLGHAVGDELLVSIASRLASCVRAGDVVGRLGGDEFAVMVRAKDDAEAAAILVAKRIVDACVLEMGSGSKAVPVHASVGVATCQGRELSAEELIHDADLAMYKAKTGGKGCFAIFDPSVDGGGVTAEEARGLRRAAA